jgi:TolB-like protein
VTRRAKRRPEGHVAAADRTDSLVIRRSVENRGEEYTPSGVCHGWQTTGFLRDAGEQERGKFSHGWVIRCVAAPVDSVAPLESSSESTSLTGAPPPLLASKPTKARWLPSRLAVTFVAVTTLTVALGYFAAVRLRTPEPRAPTAGQTAMSPVVSGTSVAVLPFLDLTENKDQEYFADGMSEELIDMLSQVPELHIPARTSSFYFKGKQASLHDIAESLRVSHVLEGSVRKSGSTIRVTAQLIRVDTGFHVWSKSYDRPLDDMFKVQDEIAQSVITALKASLLDKPLVNADAATNSETYNLYLQARAMNQRHTEATT